jgi:hypothetical protein
MDLYKLKMRIEKLNKDELVEIFKIIHRNDNKYTSNNNGIFIDLNTCDDKTVNDIRNFLTYVDENRKRLNELEEKVNKKKVLFNNFAQQHIPIQPKRITTDYSPFVTVDGDITIENNIAADNDDDFDNLMDNNDTKSVCSQNGDSDLDDDDTLLFNDISNYKNKKKTSGIKARLMKKCKNVSSNIVDSDELDKDDNVVNNVELSLELEYDV